MNETFSEKQIADYQAYEEVREEGAYNMFDPRARRATGLSPAEYMFVMKHYTGLKNAAWQSKEKATP